MKVTEYFVSLYERCSTSKRGNCTLCTLYNVPYYTNNSVNVVLWNHSWTRHTKVGKIQF